MNRAFRVLVGIPLAAVVSGVLVTTVFGNSSVRFNSGHNDGVGAAATFSRPSAIAVNPGGTFAVVVSGKKL